jgi:transketolase
MEAVAKAFADARACKGKPTAIVAKTVKGKGVSFMENQAGWHGKAPNDEEFETAIKDLEKVGEDIGK